MLVIICVCLCVCFFFFKQKTAYEMRISDWSSDVCSSDLKRVYWSDRTPASGVRSTANTDFCPITPKYCVIYQHWNVRQLSCRRASSGSIEIGRAHVCTQVTNAHIVCRHLLETKNSKYPQKRIYHFRKPATYRLQKPSPDECTQHRNHLKIKQHHIHQ